MGVIDADPAVSDANARPRVMQVLSKLDLGGAEVVALDLVRMLHADVDFAVATVIDLAQPSAVGRDMAARLAALGVPVFAGTRGHFKKGGVLRSAWRLAGAIRTFRPDLVHLHTEMPELTWAVASVLFPNVRRVAVLRTVHNCELWIGWQAIGRWVTGRLAKSRTVAVSQAAAQADEAIVTGSLRKPVEVIYNGVTLVEPVAGQMDHAAPLRILFAGRFIAQKGPDLLPAILEVARTFTDRRDVVVTVAGQGPLEPGLRPALIAAVPDWTVDMRAPIEHLSARLGEYDVVLMPSRYEGFGLLAVEALVAGVPLVATSAPGLDEILPTGYPFKAPVDDVIALGTLLGGVIADPERARGQVAQLSRPLTERFSMDAMAAHYARFYGVASRQEGA